MDSSGMGTLLSCPRRFELERVEGLGSEQERASLSFGTAWHGIMENWRKGDSPEDAVSKVLSTYKDPENDYRTAQKLQTAFARYRQRFGDGDYSSIVAVECPFSVLVSDSLAEPLEGKLDLVAYHDSNEGNGKELWVIDYKTASRLESNWTNVYAVSNQFKAYYFAGKKLWPSVTGVLVDVFHATKGVQKSKDEDEHNGNRFYRLPLRFSENAVEEWQANFSMASFLKGMYEETGYYPQNAPTACMAFGSVCPFLDACAAQDPEVREKIKSNFPKSTFDIWAGA